VVVHASDANREFAEQPTHSIFKELFLEKKEIKNFSKRKEKEKKV